MKTNHDTANWPPLNRQPHTEFLELGALAASDSISEQEQTRLTEHLADCAACRHALDQYQAVVGGVFPALAARELPDIEPGPGWSEEHAEARLLAQIAREHRPGTERRNSQREDERSEAIDRETAFAGQPAWRRVWIPSAACVLLLLALGLSAYRVGIRHTRSAPDGESFSANAPTQPGWQTQLAEAAHQRELARARIAQREREIVELRRQLQRQKTEMKQWQLAQARLKNQLHSSQRDRQDLAAQGGELAPKLAAAEAASQNLEQQLSTLERQRVQETQGMKALEAKVFELTHALSQRDAKVEQQQKMLAYDRDIRELMGARDLSVAEVHEAAATGGAAQKAYGRVFYTKGESLVFYAYDLQPDAVKSASTFQAWGRRDANSKQALSLGVFYMDNPDKRRWVLKVEDPKTLAMIDAVFVTVEPKGGSHHPSGRSLLFAKLRVDHP